MQSKTWLNKEPLLTVRMEIFKALGLSELQAFNGLTTRTSDTAFAPKEKKKKPKAEGESESASNSSDSSEESLFDVKRVIERKLNHDVSYTASKRLITLGCCRVPSRVGRR